MKSVNHKSRISLGYFIYFREDKTMYNTDFDMKKARYSVIKKTEFIKYHNGLNVGWNRFIYMESKYGIYTYSLEDAATFIIKELIKFYSSYGLKNKDFYERRKLLLDEYEKYVVMDLRLEKSISGRVSFLEKGVFDTYVLGSVSIWSFNATYPLINNIIAWNKNRIDLKYLYPVYVVDEEHYRYSWQKRQHRPRFHSKRYKPCLGIPKREKVEGSDPEYSCVLSARQKNRERTCNWGKTYHKNRNNVPGDWKHYNKCRKQWAKNIENPSYEKLSKAVWKQDLLEEEKLFEQFNDF